MKKNTIAITLAMLLAFAANAQNKKKAQELYDTGNYPGALQEYLLLLQEEPDNYTYNFRAGVCQLQSSAIKSKAIPYLNKASSFAEGDPIAFYLLGKAYQYSYQFDAAIRAFEKFIALSRHDEENVRYAKKKIEYCYNAKEFMKFPLDVEFENLGENINSAYPDYFPFVSSNESFLLFNSKRDDGSNKLPDGTFSSSIYVSQVKDGRFQEAHKMMSIGGDSLNEQVIGLSADGSKLLYAVEQNKVVTMYLADISEGEISEPEALNITPPEALTLDVTASIASDGKTIYLSSKLKGGLGGADIYVARKLPNGQWSKLQNLGPEINTEWDEFFPNISPDGKNLYFSSEGHTGLGGMDIYRSEWKPDSNAWGRVRNLGFPLNTPDDDMNFRLAADKQYGYLSVNREDGYGDLDVYRVHFGEAEPRFTIVTGQLYSIRKEQLRDDVFISVVDLSKNRVYGEYLPNARTGRYIMALPPGRYTLIVEVQGYQRIDQSIEVLDKASFQPYIHQDMVLKPAGILMPLPKIAGE